MKYLARMGDLGSQIILENYIFISLNIFIIKLPDTAVIIKNLIKFLVKKGLKLSKKSETYPRLDQIGKEEIQL